MNKKLPNIYKGKILKNLNQKETVIEKKEANDIEIIESKGRTTSVNKQIKDIFNSPRKIYTKKLIKASLI